jgi:NTP pyrophosphatase (non-canonical NTP hydrolase)
MSNINNEQLKKWAKQIYEIACAHGWHEESKPDGLWMALVLSEVAEAIEADRKDRRVTEKQLESFIAITTSDENYKATDLIFKASFENFIKGTLEEELADVVIRLLDYINMRWENNYDWDYSPSDFDIPDSFPVAAWKLVKNILERGSMNVRDSIQYVLEWSEKLGINISQFIEWKMKYNSLRSYKHGGKKY